MLELSSILHSPFFVHYIQSKITNCRQNQFHPKTIAMQTKPYVFLYCLLFIPCILQGQFLAADINKSAVGSNPTLVRAGLNQIVFTASSDKYGRELFVSNGLENGVALVKDLTPGNASTVFLDVSVIGNACYFVTSTDAQTTQLWYMNLSTTIPELLKTTTGGGGIISEPNGGFIQLGDQVYFLLRNAG